MESNTFGKRLAELRTLKGLSKVQMAPIVNTTSASLGRYEKDDVQPTIEFFLSIKKAWPETDLNWLIFGTGSSTITNNVLFPADTNKLLLAALSVADKKTDGYSSLNNKLEEFIVHETFREKFTFPQSSVFFSAVYTHFERLKILRLFARSMRDAKDKIKNLSPANGKSILKDTIMAYELSFRDKYDNLIGEKQRKFLLGLIEDFSDVECFAILSDIDRAIEILEDEKLTKLDRFNIPLLSSPVKL